MSTQSHYNINKPTPRNLIKSKKLLDKYPDKCHIILKTTLLTQTKYLVPKDITVAMFQSIIRKRMKDVDSQKAIFIFFLKSNGDPVIHSATTTIGSIFQEFKSDQDGFLYATIEMENTFG